MFVTETLLIAVLSYLLALLLIYCYRRNQRLKIFKKYGIPGPKPNFFAGNLHQLKINSLPHITISSWQKQYGNVFGFFMGQNSHVVINDITVLKKILISDFHNFTNRSWGPFMTGRILHSILAQRNSKWKETRAILTPTFSSNKIKTMFKVINDKISITLEVVTAKALVNEELDMLSVGESLALDVIADTSLALKVNCQKNTNDDFFITIKQIFASANNKIIDLLYMFPMLTSLISFVIPYTVYGRMTDMIIKNLKDVIQYRRNHSEVRGTDLLQLLLDSSELSDAEVLNDNQKNKNVQLTDSEVVGNAYISLLGGFDTTANAFAFIFYLLVQHPEAQKKLHQEIREWCPDDDNFTYDILNNLSYLDQVVKESLRMYPPLVHFITRDCQNQYHIGKYVIPKRMAVYIPVWDIHHDPHLWPDPWTFKPERFSPENKSKIEKMSYLPFGEGPRNCIGMRLALMELKLAVARLIRKFEFISCENTEIPLIVTCPTVLLTPKNGVRVKAKIRE